MKRADEQDLHPPVEPAAPRLALGRRGLVGGGLCAVAALLAGLGARRSSRGASGPRELDLAAADLYGPHDLAG